MVPRILCSDAKMIKKLLTERAPILPPYVKSRKYSSSFQHVKQAKRVFFPIPCFQSRSFKESIIMYIILEIIKVSKTYLEL